MWVILVYTILVIYVIRVLRSKPEGVIIFLFLVLWLLLTLITVILNAPNPIQYIDKSDAINFTEWTTWYTTTGRFDFHIDSKYVPYVLILATVMKTSFKSLFMFAFCSVLLNFTILGILFTVLSRRLEELRIYLRISNWFMIIFNPLNFLIAVSTVRDVFIVFLSTVLLLEISSFALQLHQRQREGRLFKIGLIIVLLYLAWLFRPQVSYFAVISAGIATVILKFFDSSYWKVIVFSALTFFLMVVIAPSNISKSLVYASTETTAAYNEARFGTNLVFTANNLSDVISSKRAMLFVSFSRFSRRFHIAFFARSYIKGLYLLFSGNLHSTFYASNGVKRILDVLYDIFRYFVFIPLFLYMIIASLYGNHNGRTRELEHGILFSRTFLLVCSSFFMLVYLAYTIQMGDFQPRVRLQAELPLLTSFFMYLSFTENDKSIRLLRVCFVLSNAAALVYVFISPL